MAENNNFVCPPTPPPSPEDNLVDTQRENGVNGNFNNTQDWEEAYESARPVKCDPNNKDSPASPDPPPSEKQKLISIKPYNIRRSKLKFPLSSSACRCKNVKPLFQMLYLRKVRCFIKICLFEKSCYLKLMNVLYIISAR